jgi:hypothetical protein
VCARGEAELTTSLQDWKSAGLAIDGCTADVSIEEHRTKLMRKVRQQLNIEGFTLAILLYYQHVGQY